MIKGIHGLLYTADADALRAFFRDKLELPFTDAGGGWLIFDLPEGDIGFHPTEGAPPAGTHNLSFYTDDIEATVRKLKANGVEFAGDTEDHGYGLVTHFLVPGGFQIQLYQPRYQKRAGRRAPAAKVAAKKKAGPARKAPAAKKPAAKKSPVRKPTRRGR